MFTSDRKRVVMTWTAILKEMAQDNQLLIRPWSLPEQWIITLRKWQNEIRDSDENLFNFYARLIRFYADFVAVASKGNDSNTRYMAKQTARQVASLLASSYKQIRRAKTLNLFWCTRQLEKIDEELQSDKVRSRELQMAQTAVRLAQSLIKLYGDKIRME